jgi:hypothetical protein
VMAAGLFLMTPATSQAHPPRRGFGFHVDFGSSHYGHHHHHRHYSPYSYGGYNSYYPQPFIVRPPDYGWWSPGYRTGPSYYHAPRYGYHDWYYDY